MPRRVGCGWGLRPPSSHRSYPTMSTLRYVYSQCPHTGMSIHNVHTQVGRCCCPGLFGLDIFVIIPHSLLTHSRHYTIFVITPCLLLCHICYCTIFVIIPYLLLKHTRRCRYITVLYPGYYTPGIIPWVCRVAAGAVLAQHIVYYIHLRYYDNIN